MLACVWIVAKRGLPRRHLVSRLLLDLGCVAVLLVGLLIVHYMLLLLLHHHLFFVVSAQLETEDLLVVDLICRRFEETLLDAAIAAHLVVRD